MSLLLTRQNVESVVSVLTPSIQAFLEAYAKRQALAIVVLDPSSPNETKVLYTQNFGDPTTWEYPFDEIALGKAKVCLRNKCDSEVVRNERPFCYKVGDPPFAGGVYVQGLVVACSGVEGYFDQMFARWIAAACRAVAFHRLQKEVIDLDLDFIPNQT